MYVISSQQKKTFSSFQPFSSTFGYIVCVSLRFAPRVDFALHILLYVHQQWIYVWAPLDTFTISFFFYFHIPLPAHLLTFFPPPHTRSEWEQTKQHIHPEIYSWHTQLFSFFYSTHSTRLSSIYFHASADVSYVVLYILMFPS